MTVLVVCGVGEVGFASFLRELHRFGVLDCEELLAWLALHGSVLRATGLALDRGSGVPDEVLLELEARFE